MAAKNQKLNLSGMPLHIYIYSQFFLYHLIVKLMLESCFGIHNANNIQPLLFITFLHLFPCCDIRLTFVYLICFPSDYSLHIFADLRPSFCQSVFVPLIESINSMASPSDKMNPLRKGWCFRRALLSAESRLMIIPWRSGCPRFPIRLIGECCDEESLLVVPSLALGASAQFSSLLVRTMHCFRRRAGAFASDSFRIKMPWRSGCCRNRLLVFVGFLLLAALVISVLLSMLYPIMWLETIRKLI